MCWPVLTQPSVGSASAWGLGGLCTGSREKEKAAPNSSRAAICYKAPSIYYQGEQMWKPWMTSLMGPVVSVSFLASRKAIGFWSLWEWWINDKQFHELELHWCESEKLIELYACQESFLLHCQDCSEIWAALHSGKSQLQRNQLSSLSWWWQDHLWQQCSSKPPQIQEQYWVPRSSEQCLLKSSLNTLSPFQIWGMLPLSGAVDQEGRARLLTVAHGGRMRSCRQAETRHSNTM